MNRKETGKRAGRKAGGAPSKVAAAEVRTVPQRSASVKIERALGAPKKPDQFIENMPLGRLIAPPWNRDPGDVTSLADSIKAKGLLQALLVAPRGQKYAVAAGNRRWAAAKLAGLTHVPVIVREMTDDELLDCIVVENLQRKDITPVEEAQAMQRLTEHGRSTRDIADRIGCAQSHVVKRLALLKLPAVALERVALGTLTLSDAAKLVELVDHPKLLKKTLESNHIGYSLERAKQALRAEERKEATKSLAKAKGWQLLRSLESWGFRPPEGAWRIGKGWGELDLDAKQHQKEPCHAIGLEPQSGEAVPCCTDRTRHPEVLTKGEQDARDSGRAASNNRASEWAAAGETRTGIAASIRPKSAEVMKLLASWWIEQAGGAMFAAVLRALGRPVPSCLEGSTWSLTQAQKDELDQAKVALGVECANNAEAASRLCWLMVAQRIESHYGHPAAVEPADDERMYVNLLRQYGGYVPLEVERQHLENQDNEAAA